MSRSRASAKRSGADFEIKMAAYLKKALGSDDIERLRTSGKLDRGDIGNVRFPNGKLVACECKNTGGTFQVTPWLTEAERERINYGAAAGVVFAKRRGTTNPEEQVVFMTARDFVTLMRGGE